MMRKNPCLIAIAVLASLQGSAQTGKEKSARPAEQTEIKADQQLEKEIQQKQLSAGPVRLVEAAPASSQKKNLVEQKKKRKCLRSAKPRH
jgi:hypothetical protein